MDYMLELRLLVLCETCNEPRVVKGSGTCPACGVPLPAEGVSTVRSELGRRRTAFKGRLNRLFDEMQRVTNPGLSFKMEGQPLSSADHLDAVLKPAMGQL